MAEEEKPKATANERELTQIGLESLQNSQELKKYQQTLVNQLMDYTDEAAAGRAASSNENAVAFSQAGQDVTEALARPGSGGPGSGAFVGKLSDFDQARSEGMARGAIDTESRLDQEYVKSLQALQEIGRGRQTKAVGGLVQAADQAASDAIQRSRSAAERAAGIQDALGSLAGTAAYRYGAMQKEASGEGLK